MKLTALFLSIVVLTLTWMPCCALEENNLHAHQIVEQQADHSCTEKEDSCCKECSPFYVCGTCIGFTFPVFSASTFVIPFKAVQHDTIYVPVELPIVFNPIWQPPKLS